MGTLGGADIEPDEELGIDRRAAGEAKDAAAVPPDGWGDDGDAAEDVAMFERQEERDEAAERGAAERGVGGAGQGSKLAIDKGLEVVHEQLTIERAAAAAELRVGDGRVLGHAVVAGVGDADEDDGLDAFLLGEAIGGGVGAPGAARKIGGGAVKEILTVMEVEDGEAAIGFAQVRDGQIDGDGAVSGKSMRVAKRAEQISGVGGELWICDRSGEEAGSRLRRSKGLWFERVEGRSRFQGPRSDALGWHQTSRGDGACDGSTTGGFQARWGATWRC